MIQRNDPCWCGSNKKFKKCHWPELSPSNTDDQLAEQYLKQYKIIIKTKKEQEGIRASCKLAARILDKLCKAATAGVTTNEINRLAINLHRQAKATPAPLNYGNPPFPKAICTSLNEVICHGIPNDVPLKNGDILNIDVTCILAGYFGDCSKMVAIGDVHPDKQRVMKCSLEALNKSIEIVKPGLKVFEIAEAIESTAKNYNCSVVDQFVGHGVGVNFHEPPNIPHHYNDLDIKLVPGMTFTIEPMINLGQKEAVIDTFDNWTARTIDKKASAQYEHTLLVTEDGCEILTKLDNS
jgi:methionyl aminopeptidase